jgi:hypothetical protein
MAPGGKPRRFLLEIASLGGASGQIRFTIEGQGRRAKGILAGAVSLP